MSPQILTVIGSYNVGFFLKGGRLPRKGETVIADSFFESGGGKGSNQAIAAASLGANVSFLGRVGDDKYGKAALELYQDRGIQCNLIQIDHTTHTGISVILIDETGGNMISVAPGANLNLTPKDIDRHEAELRGSSCVAFQLENEHSTVIHGIRKCHEWGIPVFLDPAPATPLPEDLYSCIEIIKPNETEAGILTGIPVDDPESGIRAGRWLCERGTHFAIVTLGSQGSVLVGEGREAHFPAPKVEAVDSTGAGDIFAGAFLSGLQNGSSMEDSIRFASIAAALATTRIGVVDAVPSLAEIEALSLDNSNLQPDHHEHRN